MKVSLIFGTLVIILLVQRASSYCPPLTAPQTTHLKCEAPVQHQLLNCSASWLPQGTVAYFKCDRDAKEPKRRRVQGRIVCYEDGTHLHIQKSGKNSSVLPCGIRKEVDKPEIHVYGYQEPVRYQVDGEITGDYRAFGEKLHNVLRSKHGSPPLRLDENLSTQAQQWAEHIGSQGLLEMSPNHLYGQNIFLAKGSNSTMVAVNDAILNWYYQGRDEYCWEEPADNWDNSLALDFSQLVWKGSKSLGLGAAPMRGGGGGGGAATGMAIIAFYNPSGNIVFDDDKEKSESWFKSNVAPLQIV